MNRIPTAKALKLWPPLDLRHLPYRRQPTFLRLQIVPRSSTTSDFVHNSSSSSGRRMSSTGGQTATKNEYLVLVPDHANSLQKRLAVRPKHFEGLVPHIASGSVVFGGATLSRQPDDEGETLDMNGSVLLIKAENEAAVRAWLANDAYTKGGVWNVDQAKIYPFRCSVRTAL